MNCSNCGSQLANNVEFCSNCGQKTNNIVNNNNNNKSNKPMIIILIIVILVSIAIVGFILLKNNNKENNNVNKENDSANKEENKNLYNEKGEEEYSFKLYDTEMPKEVANDKELSKNIEIYKVFFNPNSTTSKYQDAYIYGKNNNSSPVKVDVEVEYYDSEGYRIDSDTTLSTIVNAESEFVLRISVKDDSLKYKNTKMLYSAQKVESYYTLAAANDLELNTTKFSNGNIETSVKNNSNIDLKNASLGCVYYKDGKEVFATVGHSFEIKVGEFGKVNFFEHLLYLKEYDKTSVIEYDDYKVFLYSAYTYDDKNY